MNSTQLPPSRPTDLITSAEAALIAGRTRALIRDAIKKGRLTGIKMPGRTGQWYVSLAEVRALWPKPGDYRRQKTLSTIFRLTDEEEREILGFDRATFKMGPDGGIAHVALPRPRDTPAMTEAFDTPPETTNDDE